MRLEWDNNLAIGVNEIDEQHKELFRRFDKLLEACNNGVGKEEIGNLLFFLDDYVQTHFRDEERLQVAHAFPDYPTHRVAHRGFVERLGQLKQDLHGDGASLSVIITTNTMLMDWLVNHIAVMDKKIGAHIAAQGKSHA